MELTHAGDDGLAGFFIGICLEGRVFFCELRKCNAHLFLTGLGLRLNRNTDNRLREFHGLKDDRVLFVAKGITGGGVLQTDCSSDVACVNHFQILSVVCVHLNNTTDTLGVILCGVVNGGTSRKRTGVHTEEAQLTDERVRSNLKCKSGERLRIGRVTNVLFFGFRVYTLNRRNIRRSRHVINNRVQKLLNTLVLIGSTAGNRNHRVVDGGLADAGLDLIDRELFTHEILLHECVVLLGDMLDHLGVILLCELFHVFRDLFATDILAEIIIVDISLHFHEVDEALEGIFRADRQLDRDSVALQSLAHHVDNAVEISAHNVHLVDIRHTRNLVFLSLTPNGLRLRLNAALCAENRYGTIENTQGTLNFNGEVNVARGVDDVDTVLVTVSVRPEARRSSGSNRDTSLLLLCHPVHRSGTVVGLADLVVDACVIKDTLGRCCFTGIDVRHDADISCKFKWYLTGHIILLNTFTGKLPSVMCESLVGFCHLMRIVTLLSSAAGAVQSVKDLSGQSLLHRLFRTKSGIARHPAQTQGLTSLRTNLDRNLIVRTANTACLNLQARHYVLHSLLENLQSVLARLLFDDLECFVNDLLSYALLTIIHDVVNQACDQFGIIHRIRQNIAFCYIASSWHSLPSFT